MDYVFWYLEVEAWLTMHSIAAYHLEQCCPTFVMIWTTFVI